MKTFIVKYIPNYKGWGVYVDDVLDLWFTDEKKANHYAKMHQKIADCKHQWEYVDDEYGSLADGGSYERYHCTTCGIHHYVPLAD